MSKFISRNKLGVNPFNILRVTFSSIARHDILKAFKDIGDRIDKAKVDADYARQEIDLRLGLSITNYLTCNIHNLSDRFKKEDTRISYGPCQFPTFWFCYQRFLEIRDFKPELYWKALLEIQTSDGKSIELDYDGDNFTSEKPATDFAKGVYDQCEEVYLDGVQTRERKIRKPRPLNTVELLVLAHEELGYDTHTTMKLATQLYSKGFISYPRTKSTKHSEHFEFRIRLDSFAKTEKYKDMARGLVHTFRCSDFLEPGETPDHPPITPRAVPAAYKGIEVGSPKEKLYDLIVRHFFATLSTECQVREVTNLFKAGEHKFKESHVEVLDKGFSKYFKIDEESLRELKVADFQFARGQRYPIDSCKVQKCLTAPPKLLSEAELVLQMEANGIGTDGTIPEHIRKIQLRKYVKLVGNEGERQRFIPTKFGIALAEGFKDIDPELIQPAVRQFIEKACQKVAECKIEKKDAIAIVTENFTSKLEVFIQDFYKIKDRLLSLEEPKEELKKAEPRKVIASKIHIPTFEETKNGDTSEEESCEGEEIIDFLISDPEDYARLLSFESLRVSSEHYLMSETTFSEN